MSHLYLNAASLFAGIGGFDLACERLGVEVALQAEISDPARAVLRDRFPKARLVGDATKADLRGVDLVCAGFPCQGLSAAASTRQAEGLLDEESMSAVIWPTLRRVYEARPRFLLLENADSLNTNRYAEDMRVLLADLVRNGYHPHVVRLNAGCFGSPMRRARTFVLARSTAWSAPPKPEARVSWRVEYPFIGVNNQQGGASWASQPSVTRKARSYTLMVTPTEVRSFLPEGVEALFGYPPGWTTAAGTATARYERLGNSVSVDAATVALAMLLQGRTARVRPPRFEYSSLYPLTTPAGGGTAGSAIGRLARTMLGTRNPNTNRIELDYCAPVYVAWMERFGDDVTPKMRGYLEAVRSLLPAPRPWPLAVDVTMEQ